MSCNPYRSMRNAAVLVYMLLAGGSLASRSRDCNCHLPSPPTPRYRFHEKRHHEKRARICRMLDQMLPMIQRGPVRTNQSIKHYRTSS
uniref:Putative secreted protein n=1 Tax=Anopheles triannulatus TaxID=58253 RepID=A0A2M4B4E8_9DIPT